MTTLSPGRMCCPLSSYSATAVRRKFSTTDPQRRNSSIAELMRPSKSSHNHWR